QGGNSFGAVGVLGTNDGQQMEIRTTGNAVKMLLSVEESGLRIQRTSSPGAPAVVNGSANNTAGLTPFPGATVAGGGKSGTLCADPVFGGTRSCGNQALALFASVGGGEANRASGSYTTIGGGASNTASSGYATVGGGFNNSALGGSATVPGGYLNFAYGAGSFAAGGRAVARGDRMFLWNDGFNDVEFDPAVFGSFGASLANTTPLNGTFIVRATGGFQFITGSSGSSCFIVPNGTGWTCVSDRNLKHSIKTVSPKSVLTNLLGMPVSTWAINGSDRRQIGPMSQDFFRAFGLGDSDRAINSVDAQGVAFAAIQGLHQIVKEKDAEIAKLKADMVAIKKRLGM
ncbi:MAG: tail fiber domain-containing protein, partial [Casimicrobium sp.]